MVSPGLVARVLAEWGLEYGRRIRGARLAGSPERTCLRLAVRDTAGTPYVLEAVSGTDLHRKQVIAQTLARLADQEMPGILPCLKRPDGRFHARVDGHWWQIVPYREGRELERPGYTRESWRGRALAGFLLVLWQRDHRAPGFKVPQAFSITDYIRTLAGTLYRSRPGLHNRLRPVLDWLDRDFVRAHDRLPVRFCHGDLHPLNVIWSRTGILAVIDWEFMGIKPEIYDFAVLTGCLGMEDPDCLSGGLVPELLGTLRDSGSISRTSWDLLPRFMGAVRFAWLAEWLRNNDREMIELETAYLFLIMEHGDEMARLWFGSPHRPVAQGSGPA